MRFDSGLLAHCGEVAHYPPIDEWKATALLLESAGYTAAWAAEHHFFWDGWTNPAPTNPVLFGTYIAAITRKLRLAQCGICLPDWHPIRLAEDLAMLDHISRGRLDFGALRGVNNRVNGNFNRHADRRDQKTNQALFWESLDVIRQAWSGEPFRHSGQFYQLPVPGWRDERAAIQRLDPRYYSEEGELTHLQLVPTPYQKPVPTWVMGDSVSSHQQAARKDLGMLTYAQSLQQAKAAWQGYRDARCSAGFDGTPERLAIMRPIYVADTREQAEAVMRPAINRMMAYGVRADSDLTRARKAFLAQDEPLADGDLTCDWFDFLVRHEHTHVGTADYVTERLKKTRDELGCEHIVLFWALPLVTYEQYESGLKLFADKVMPHF